MGNLMENTSNLPVFKLDRFAQNLPDNVTYGFFKRGGGVSDGLYASLNCGSGSNDGSGSVEENRARVAHDLGVRAESLLSLYQIHGDVCLSVVGDPVEWTRPKADAFITDRPGVGLGILTADCAPVLFYGAKKNNEPIIGAAHAGWRGALGGVLESTIKTFKSLEVDMDTLRACIGPCIQRRSYEVSLEFQNEFLGVNPEYEVFFQAGQKINNPHFDLPGFCSFCLMEAGVKNVYISDEDTYTLEDQYFSYRRATHRKESDYGRQISAIAISG